MKKIHLLIRKEDINENKMAEGQKIAVVFDILLATTTITSALYDGAIEVIPVMSHEEALLYQNKHPEKELVLAGERDAKEVEGLIYPTPLTLKKIINGKTLVLTTTNGTIALRKASNAKRTYVSSLLNNRFVGKEILRDWEEESLVLICSGNSGEVSFEDLYGAGHFIDCILSEANQYIELTDAALAALSIYRGRQNDSFNVLKTSFVGRLFQKHDATDELKYASRKNTIQLAPLLIEGRITTLPINKI
jgi:2-phosphosulfolactate phosphatase